MTIKQTTTYKLWRLKWSRSKILSPGDEDIVYEDITTGWEEMPGKNLRPWKIKIISDDELAIADSRLLHFEKVSTLVEEDKINFLSGFEDEFGNKVKLNWAPGTERK